MDLTPPDIHKVVPARELEGPLTGLDDEEEPEPTPTVEVNREKAAPYVPGGIAGVWWGITHPSQAWRIFAPVQ